MKFSPDSIYHVYNEGNNHEVLFRNDEDCMIFLRMIRKYIHSNTEIIAWCLMPDHFHLLVYTDERSCILKKQGGLEIEMLTNGIRKLLSGYARIYNKRYQRTGSLFRQKTKAKNASASNWVIKQKLSLEDYCSNCFSYIHENPVAAGLVKSAGDWLFSSYVDYSGARNGTLCNKALASKYCGYDERDFINLNRRTDENFLDEFNADE